MHRASHALAGEISSKQIDRRFLAPACEAAFNEFSITEDIQRPLRNRDVPPLPSAYLQWKSTQRFPGGQDFRLTSGTKEKRRSNEQNDNQGSAHPLAFLQIHFFRQSQ
jgi:hypothetical protein